MRFYNKNISLNSTLLILLVLGTLSCSNPYKGFKGVNKKGMKGNAIPSQELKDDYKKASKKMKRVYRREMRKRRKRMGSKPEK